MKVTLKGKGKWITKEYKEWDRQDGKPDKRWSFLFYPDPESLEEIRDLQMRGLKNRLRKDDDGICISFGRPVEKEIKGKIVTFNPPKIVDLTGKEYDKLGNGSEINLELEVYEHAVPGSKNKSIAARWEGIVATKVVEYTSNKPAEDTVEPVF